MKYIDRTVESIKLAYMSNIPIVWIVTSTKETANLIACRFAEEHFGGIRLPMGQSYVFKSIGSFCESPHSDRKKSCIYFDWLSDPNDDDIRKIKSIFETFIGLHQSLEIEEEARIVIDNDRQSVFRKSLMIVASPTAPNCGWLNRYINTIYVGSMHDDEIEKIIVDFLKFNDITIGTSFIERLVVNLRGVSEREITTVLSKCLVLEYFDIDKEDNQNNILLEIRTLKRQMLDGFNGLKWIPVSEETMPASGLGEITSWLNKRKDIFDDPEKKQREGFDVPKGILVTGIPGTGKSLMAKEAARILNLPLIAMDLGDLQEGIVGKSEEHMAAALRMVDAMAPCVLWIDEIEKAFSGANSSQSDGGVMRRMFGKFLTWMQEKQSFCFVFATSNDISKLPPELFRSERFDEKFYNFMPSVEECSEIFVSCINYHNNKYKKDNGNTAILFDGVFETKDYWINLLNSAIRGNDEVKLSSEGIWLDGTMPNRKLFTGADISAFVKQLKFEILSNREESHKGAITKVELQKVVSKVFNEFLPYGETNLNDIAICFVSLTHNRFKSASSNEYKNSIVCFSDFKQETSTLSYDPARFGDSPYNQALYRCVVGSVNFIALKNSKYKQI